MNDYAKGILTGSSLIFSFFILVSAQSQRNDGDFDSLTVKSLHVAYDRDKGSGIVIYPDMIVGYNQSKKQIFFLGTSTNDGGHIATFNSDGLKTTELGTNNAYGGVLKTYNKWEQRVGYFGSNEDQDGQISIYDRYGYLGWGTTGKRWWTGNQWWFK